MKSPEKMSAENLTIKSKVRGILIKYQAIPLNFGESPGELYLGRRLHLSLDAIFPHTHKSVTHKDNTEKGVQKFEVSTCVTACMLERKLGLCFYQI